MRHLLDTLIALLVVVAWGAAATAAVLLVGIAVGPAAGVLVAFLVIWFSVAAVTAR